MDEASRLNLKKLVKEYGTEETTSKIRKIKHSKHIREDVYKMIEIKKKYKRLNNKMLNNLIDKQCVFLHNNYTNIYNKLKNDTIDVNMLFKFINLLESIENGEMDQHEASVNVGKILKEIYIDSAIKEDTKRNNQVKKNIKSKKVKNISWNEYKQLGINH
tara:strand:+ start:166 stop:645 length:480 start_codon:yes stop_codon:yes gene_type:complete